MTKFTTRLLAVPYAIVRTGQAVVGGVLKPLRRPSVHDETVELTGTLAQRHDALLLKAIHQLGWPSATEAIEAAELTPGRGQQALRRLYRQGLIVNITVVEDGRKAVRLSLKGRACYKAQNPPS